jgi:hypothetical protein
VVKAINDAVAEARHDPESLERLRATFTKDGIPARMEIQVENQLQFIHRFH